jgi:hypothetical protein
MRKDMRTTKRRKNGSYTRVHVYMRKELHEVLKSISENEDDSLTVWIERACEYLLLMQYPRQFALLKEREALIQRTSLKPNTLKKNFNQKFLLAE